MNVRTTGRLVAGVLFTAVVVVILVAVRNQRKAPAPAVPDAAVAPPDMAPGGAPDEGGVAQLVAAGEKGKWTRVDRATGLPEVVLVWLHLTPQASGRYDLDHPEAWVYSAGKPRAHLSAPSGKVLWPTREEPPEAGDLTGGVVVRVFEEGAETAELPALDRAVYVLHVDSLHFEGALSQIETGDPLLVEGPGLRVEGTGLTARFSQTTKRLQYFRTLGKLARVTPSELNKGVRSVSGTKHNAGGKEQAGGAAKPGTPRIDHYETTITGPLKLAQGGRTVDSDELKIWAKLVDGRLADGAVAPFETVKKDPGKAGADAKAVGSTAKSKADADEITMDWSGPLELKLASEAPKELLKDALRARFASGKAGGVHVVDAQSKATLDCQQIEYGATTRTLRIVGTGPRGVVAKVGPTLEIATALMEADLTSGVGSMPSAGRAISTEKDGGSVAWGGRCDFVLDTSDGPAGAGGVLIPTEVTFSDKVEASSPEGSGFGDFAKLSFAKLAGANGAKPTAAISRLMIQGNARAQAGTDGRIAADELTVAFAPSGADKSGKPIATVASARGNARASQDEQSILAKTIDARLGTDAVTGRNRIVKFEAQDEVHYTGRDRIEALADRLTADVPGKLVDLVGMPATIGRFEPEPVVEGAKDGKKGERLSLAAERIHLDGAARRVNVDGAGEATYSNERDEPGTYDRMRVGWSKKMEFDDATGEAQFFGAVEARGVRGATERQLGTGERAVAQVTARPLVEEKNAAGGTNSPRRMERLTLYGAEADGDIAATPARVQGRRYAQAVVTEPGMASGADAGVLEGMIDLRGPSIEVLPPSRAISIPGPGILLVEDRRSMERDKATSPDAVDVRGTTVFDWKGTLETVQGSGAVKMSGGVRVRHLPPGASEAMLLECGELTSQIEWPQENAPDKQPKLRSIEASGEGGVYVKQLKKQLRGGSLSYDTVAGEVRVAGTNEASATLFDEETGQTASAAVIVLNPETGVWRIEKAGTVVIPR